MNSIEDDDSFRKEIQNLSTANFLNSEITDQFLINPEELNTTDQDDLLSDLDPDSNYLNEEYNSENTLCKYYEINDFNKLTSNLDNSKSHFSLMHLNIRSVPKNLDKLDNILHLFNHNFSIIALTETWLKPSNADVYCLHGYEHTHATPHAARGTTGATSKPLGNRISNLPRIHPSTSTTSVSTTTYPNSIRRSSP